MGILEFFGKGPLSAGKIDKVAKLAANPFAQPDVRMREMERLLKDGTPAALKGVLKRFASNANGHIADEDEKKWLEDHLVEVGESALAPLGEYIQSEEMITYALRAYRRIAGDARATGFFIEVLQRYGADDHRSGDAKLQVVHDLGEHLNDERVLLALLPHLLDHSDDVRFAVMDLLERKVAGGGLAEELAQSAAQNLGEIVCGKDLSPRIQRRAAQILSEQEWSLPNVGEEQLATVLADEYFVDKKHYLRRRLKKS